MFKNLRKAWAERRRLKRRKKNLGAVILELVDERSKVVRERRQLRDRLAKVEKRDPKDEERVKLLDRKARELHKEIMRKGEEEEELTERIKSKRKRRKKVDRKWTRVGKWIKKKARQAARKHGPDAAIRAAQKDNGKHEQPPGSNWGGVVTKMILFTGYTGPVYWCGCALAWWTLKKAGGKFANKIRRGYAGFIYQDAKAGVNGLSEVSKPVKGGCATLWDFEHIVMTTGKVKNGMFETWGGNTSAGDGSLSNGGQVALRWFPLSDADIFAKQEY